MKIAKTIGTVLMLIVGVMTVSGCTSQPQASGWRCVATDRGGRTWYWVAPDKSVAIANARRACRRNSPVGGCRVPVGSCSLN